MKTHNQKPSFQLAKLLYFRNIYIIGKAHLTKFTMHFTHLFVSLIASKILSLENTKENFAFFCLLLTYSYLCSPKTR